VLGLRERQHPGPPAEAHRRVSGYPPASGSDLDRPPALVGEIEIDATGMLGDPDMDRTLGRIELGAGLEQVERRTDRCRAQGLPGGLVMSALQPGPQALASDRPGFPVTVDQQIGKGGAGGGVKELDRRRRSEEPVGEHGQALDALPA
jgi:hypothetical protein